MHTRFLGASLLALSFAMTGIAHASPGQGSVKWSKEKTVITVTDSIAYLSFDDVMAQVKTNPDPAARANAANSLGIRAIEKPTLAPQIIKSFSNLALGETSKQVRWQMAYWLGRIGESTQNPAVAAQTMDVLDTIFIKDRDDSVFSQSLSSMARIAETYKQHLDRATNHLINLGLADEEEDVRKAAIRSLVWLSVEWTDHLPKTIEKIMPISVLDSSEKVRVEALEQMGYIMQTHPKTALRMMGIIKAIAFDDEENEEIKKLAFKIAFPSKDAVKPIPEKPKSAPVEEGLTPE